jgi:hypothetical protein
MYFWGFTAHRKSSAQPPEKSRDIFQVALYLATQDIDDVTGQSFTIHGRLNESNRGRVG